jgi:hypothetical protein
LIHIFSFFKKYEFAIVMSAAIACTVTLWFDENVFHYLNRYVGFAICVVMIISLLAYGVHYHKTKILSLEQKRKINYENYS